MEVVEPSKIVSVTVTPATGPHAKPFRLGEHLRSQTPKSTRDIDLGDFREPVGLEIISETVERSSS